jgi:hypothetical protein
MDTLDIMALRPSFQALDAVQLDDQARAGKSSKHPIQSALTGCHAAAGE